MGEIIMGILGRIKELIVDNPDLSHIKESDIALTDKMKGKMNHPSVWITFGNIRPNDRSFENELLNVQVLVVCADKSYDGHDAIVNTLNTASKVKELIFEDFRVNKEQVLDVEFVSMIVNDGTFGTSGSLSATSLLVDFLIQI